MGSSSLTLKARALTLQTRTLQKKENLLQTIFPIDVQTRICKAVLSCTGANLLALPGFACVSPLKSFRQK
jgi:hypothetical protein